MKCEYYGCNKTATEKIDYWSHGNVIAEYCKQHVDKIMNITGCPHRRLKR